MEGHHAAGGDRDFLAGLGVAPGTLRLVAQLEIAEAGQLHAVPLAQAGADLLEERLDHVLGFALVEADLFEEQIGEFRLGQRHARSLIVIHFRSVAPTSRDAASTRTATAASASASSRVFSVSCITTRKARLFLPAGSPCP